MKYLSLFSGIGGFELGIGDKAECIGYSEIDKYAIQTYEKHFKHKNYGDATKIKADELPDFDMLCGGFPCQAFSIAGKRRGFKDTRGTLFFDIARIIEVKKPKIVFLENVKGLLNHNKGETFRVIIQTLSELGYDVQWMVLNSKDFGVPQNRERVFIIGHLRGTPRPEVFPIGEGNKEYMEVQKRGNKQPKIIQPVLTPDRENKRQDGRRMKEDGEPSFTLTAQDKHGIYDGAKIRRLTPLECERLQGLPDNWTSKGTDEKGEDVEISDTQRYKTIGNAVTVNVVKEIFNKIVCMKTNHKIITGDSRNMAELQDKSVHLVITSPPYWQLKDYGTSDQIGFNDNYEDYINNLNLVWKECFRVLNDGCRLCINIGDQFARSVYYGRYKIIPIRTEIIKFCETIGFDYMGAIIWQKATTMNTTGGATIMGSFPYPRNGIIKLDYEFILIFKKSGDTPFVSREIKEKSKMTKEEWNQYFTGHWNFNGAKQDKHLAMFPEELPKRLIKMFSFVGDEVLDPFLGSGTTTLAAKNLGRNSVGYEINKKFLPIIKEKIGLNKEELFRGVAFEIIEQKDENIDYKNEISKLPYIFKDSIKFSRKIDPKKLKFGSKIDSTNNDRSFSSQ